MTDVSEPIYAYRVWSYHVRKRRIAALWARDRHPPPVREKVTTFDDLFWNTPTKTAPFVKLVSIGSHWAGWNIGLHSSKFPSFNVRTPTFDHPSRQYDNLPVLGWRAPSIGATGIVEVSGEVIELEKGFLSTAQTVQRLWIAAPREHHAELSDRYQCDVYPIADSPVKLFDGGVQCKLGNA